ncbi:hypothetical protein BURPS406E_P0388 [Burkholderia pseudomallei 406e]|nr:hypothetical protein BURPS406E_P0388 [Burkholderia pseudomallei 406e]
MHEINTNTPRLLPDFCFVQYALEYRIRIFRINQLDPFTSCPVASIPIQLDRHSFPIKHLRISRHLDRS